MIANKIKEIVEKRKNSLKQEPDTANRDEKKQKGSKERIPLSQSIKNCSEIAIISEIKPASPTLGKIRENMNVERIATIMEKAGAIGLSVLTEPNYFKGSYKNLEKVIKNTSLPCLMKDFVIDEKQIKKASNLGATNILLINAIINLEKFYELSINYEVEPLIEIHEEEEIQEIKKLREIGYDPKLIGVNNRDLKTLEINLETSEKLIPRIKRELGEDIIVISESGIKSYEDILNLQQYQANAFLIGTLIMQSINIGAKIQSLRGKRRE